jgi:hypothetical protein
MAHPVSTFQWSDVGFRQVGSGDSIHLVGLFCHDQSLPFTRDARNNAFRSEEDLRLLFVLDSRYVARGRSDTRRKEIGM